MPTQLVRCKCEECISRNPDGVLMSRAERSAHAIRPSHALPSSSTPTVESPPAQSDENTAGAQIFVSTLLDPGPDVDNHPSRLWTSRHDFQHSRGDDTAVDPHAPDFDELVTSLHRLTSSLEDITEGIGTLSISQCTPPAGSNTIIQNCVEVDSIAPAPPLQTDSPIPPPATPTPPSTRNKRNRNRTTMTLLRKMDEKLRDARIKLSNPSLETLNGVESDVSAIRQALDEINSSADCVVTLKCQVIALLHNVDARLQEVMQTLPNPTRRPVTFDSSHHYDVPVNQSTSVAQVSLFLGVVCSVIMGVSRRAGDLILSLIRLVIELVSSDRDGNRSPLASLTLRQIPRSINDALAQFNLEGQTTVYATCPACHYTHKPKTKPGSPHLIYPSHCANRPNPGDPPCNEPLLLGSDGDSDRKPIKPFVYHHFADYLAGLLSQHEKEMDKACDDCFESLQHPPPTFVKSVFDAEFIRTFEAPTSGKLFVDRPETEGRYLFALNVDFFNVEGMSVRGAKTSCGLISMACLNLPAEIRYLPENMYLVGIVPGPEEPRSTKINHYLRPLMDDMVGAWVDGIYFTKTENYPNGRHTHSAIILVVNDLPAARQAAALAAHNANIYCSVCGCTQLSTRGNTDFDSWHIRDHNEMRKQAEAWRDAATTKERESIFERHGVRWSELWRLPYWNPTRQLVVDSMHCILEGLGQHHSRDVLGLTSAIANEKGPVVQAFTHEFRNVDQVRWDEPKVADKEVKHLAEIHNLLTAPIEDQSPETFTSLYTNLLKRNKGPLAFVCKDIGIPVRSDRVGQPSGVLFKADYARALVEWRRGKPLVAAEQRPRITTPHVIQHIRNVIRDTVTPSWLGSVPHNFGDKAAGSLKADEWRTMYTVYLPLALVSLWGEGTSHAPSVSPKLRDILDHTMALVSAITIACLRTMTVRRAHAYRAHIANWVRNLQHLHPHIQQRTNNHMAVHIFDFLLLFGPTRSWWCFPFERLIGQLQRLPHNHRFGQLESTILRAFVAAAKLRRWLARSDCPPAIKECKVLFDKSYAPKKDDYSGAGEQHHDGAFVDKSQIDTEEERREVPVPTDLRSLVDHDRIVLRARFKHSGIVYARSSTHLGNSLIHFYPRNDKLNSPVPGTIKYILNKDSRVVFAVQRQLHVTPGVVDPFAPYPDFPAKLYSSSMQKDLELVEPSSVLGHYARWAVSEEHVVILSLSKD